MSGKMRRLVPLVTIALLAAPSPAQNKQDVERVKQKKLLEELVAKRTYDLTQAAARKALLDALNKRQKFPWGVLKPPRVRMRIGPKTGGTRGWRTTTVNPILKGEYKKALDRLDKARAKLVGTSDAKAAGEVIDEIERELLGLRRGLFEMEKAQKTTWALTPKKGAVVKLVPYHKMAMPQVWGRRLPIQGQVILGNPFIIQTNPLYRGAYAKAAQKLASVRNELNTITDPRKARKVVDRMERVLLDLRRSLWEHGKHNRESKTGKQKTERLFYSYRRF